jgi:histidinol phosphatase-like PHP family hydrolase
MRPLKLDLHTHCFELTRYSEISIRLIDKLVKCIKAKGLDGIAVTEHNNSDYGYKVKEIVEDKFSNEVLIIPGQEINIWPVQIVELYLPDQSTFRFLAHPGYPADYSDGIGDLHGIELYNPLHDWHIDQQKVKETAQRYQLFLLANSDAHTMDDIGIYFNELSLEKLSARTKIK